MSAMAAETLLICTVIMATTGCGKSIQNFDSSPNDFSPSRYTAQKTSLIGFNNQNRPIRHSIKTFNLLSSSLVSSAQSVFSSIYSNRNSISSSVYAPVTFGQPLQLSNYPSRLSLQIQASQSSGMVNAGSMTFGRTVDTPVSFASKPTQSVLPSQLSKTPNAPHSLSSFVSVPILFPGPTSFIRNEPIVTNVIFTGTGNVSTDFAVPQTVSPTNESPAGRASVTDSDVSFSNEDCTCILKHGTVYFDGNCEILLSRASCPEDRWLLIDVNGSPYCTDRQCPWGTLNYLGDCVDPGDHEVCNLGQILYVDFTGLVECDCEPELVFDSTSGNCYGIHEQGFCDAAMYLERDNQGNIVCVPNPCISDKYVEQDGVCYEKNYRGHCPPNQVIILPQLVTADCIFIVLHSIFDVPTIPCSPGSRRDFQGRCRGEFRVPSQSSIPTSSGGCPSNFVKDPRGTCRKVVDLFG